MRPLQALVAGVLAVGALACGHPPPASPAPAIKTTCLSNLKQVALAVQIYEADHDDGLPSRDFWIDTTFPYAKSEMLYHCPEAPGPWGYAFNGALDLTKLSKLDAPGDTPVVYDSVNPIKNASDRFASLPTVRRHGANNVSYADGHTQALLEASTRAVVH